MTFYYSVRPTAENFETIIAGDFNFDPQKGVGHFQYLEEVHHLQQIIDVPTPNSETLIDHIYTSESAYVKDSGVVTFGISDHHMVFLVRKRRLPSNYHKH